MNTLTIFLLGLFLLLLSLVLKAIGKKTKRSSPRRRVNSLPTDTYPQPTHYKAQHENVPDIPIGNQDSPNDPISPLSVFQSKPPLTPREATCYWSLANHLNGHYIVLPQVAFSAFLRVEGGDSKSNYRRFATMRQKVADFLIVRPDFSIVALIELDDSTHANKKEADQQRDAAIKQAGIRVFRIPKVPHGDQVQRLCDVLLKLDQLKQA
jgi:hypothetical protein